LLSDYTPRLRNVIASRITTPWNHQFDVKLDRTFSIGGTPLTAFLYVQNLFNRKNIQHVYWRTGSATQDGTFLDPSFRNVVEMTQGEEFFTLYDLINLDHRQHYQLTQGGDLFGRPREIRFGLQVGLKL